ncbi:MAG: response regulator transcription factor [bacterium]
MNRRVFIIDDEPDIRKLISVHLKRNAFEPVEFDRGSDALDALEEQRPALIILDLMLPDEDGLEICRRIRANEDIGHIPVIMLTAKSEETDKIIGLELGADDYITKPFSPRELIARIKAVLRRYSKDEEKKEKENNEIKIGSDLVLHKNQYKATINGEDIGLTATEFNILLILARHKGWVYSRKQILQKLWGDEKFVTERTVDVHIRHLREKLKSAGRHIVNVRSVGYKIEE